jgi:hypothetical protein
MVAGPGLASKPRLIVRAERQRRSNPEVGESGFFGPESVSTHWFWHRMEV